MDQKSPLIMGILNVAPDSFSDGGRFLDPAYAEEHARALITQGAAVIDIGAESTAPGSSPIGAEEEQRRLLPVLKQLKHLPIQISVDTYRSSTACKAVEHGATWINDVSGLRHDPDLVRVVADAHATVVIMHSKESAEVPHASASQRRYQNIVQEIARFLLDQAEVAARAGVAANRIVLDPGFGKFISHDPADTWELLERFAELVECVSPFPVLVAVSRKGFLGGKLSERDPISQLVALRAIQAGASIVRTHNVQMMHEFLTAREQIPSNHR